jgi:Trehalase
MNAPTKIKNNSVRCRAPLSHQLCFLCSLLFTFSVFAADPILKPDSFSHYIDRFNSMEDENVTNFISNTNSWSWLSKEIPFFECPDHEVEEMYYFRWWSFRKHLEKTPNGFVFTEFLTRSNPISSALGHHLMEGRWLHDQSYLDDYVRYWFHDDASRTQLHKYSQWTADALYQRYLVTGDKKFLIARLPDLTRDYEQWEKERLTTNGLFWQYDVRDAMEESISGSRTNKNLRPTINSYMFGNAQAIALIAKLAGDKRVATEYEGKAAHLRQLVQEKLWDSNAGFFEAVHENGTFANAREEIGFIPWYFELPDKAENKFNSAWTQLGDTKGFSAPYGITTAERRHPQFRSHGYGHCEWDGAVWPFATSQTLHALANVVRDYKQSAVSSRDYFDAFLTYVHSQHADGRPYIGEYLDETTGQWINGKGDRSRFYNHSTFADLVISGVVGLCPSADNSVKISPLLPAGTWNWFCLDGVKYHGHTLTIIWDQDGTRYHRGQGLIVLADGKEIAHGNQLSEITGKLP